jgi:Fur family ferric uptake transcriptional regulator
MTAKRIDDLVKMPDEMEIRAENVLKKYLATLGLKQTGQRHAILHTFLETRDHLSAEELYGLVKKRDSKVGLATVYRTLKLLTQCGLASEVQFKDGMVRYEQQYNRRGHYHMICVECGDSVEFFSTEIKAVESLIANRFHYSMTRHTFQIHGTCSECDSKSRTAK